MRVRPVLRALFGEPPMNVPDDVMRRCRHALTSASNWPDEQIRAVLNAAGYDELLDLVSELEIKRYYGANATPHVNQSLAGAAK